jgi:hypothetical protein
MDQRPSPAIPLLSVEKAKSCAPSEFRVFALYPRVSESNMALARLVLSAKSLADAEASAKTIGPVVRIFPCTSNFASFGFFRDEHWHS